MVKQALIILILLVACSKPVPDVKTGSVPGDADDCAIWIHSLDHRLSVVIGNDKAENGGLYVWDLAGKQLSFVPMAQPINLDVRYGMVIGGQRCDIVVTAERAGRVHVFKVDLPSRTLSDITTVAGIDTGFSGSLYGLTLYRNPKTYQMYLFLTEQTEHSEIHQILLEDDGKGRVKGTLVRRFGANDHSSYVEGMCADDHLGYLYCADEKNALLKFHAVPEKGDALVQRFATDDGIKGDREGVALYSCAEGKGYLLLSSQGNATLKIYEREGNNRFVTTIAKKGATSTDGIAATSCTAGPFKYGFVVCHNSRDANFVLYAWEGVAGKELIKCVCEEP